MYLRQILLVVSLLIVQVATAQQTHPTTAPEDPATPRGALRTLNQAMRNGDVVAIRQLFLATSPAEQRMVDADASMAAALARLRAAAVEAFGPHGADIVT